MNTYKITSERGQSLVLLALGLVAFVAILALVLDGGMAYASKRQAQNAADAGALAGATTMCKTKSVDAGVAAAISYAISNGADEDPEPQVVASLSNATVQVTATVTKDTFFAGVIGFPQVSPVAVAVAACKTPVGMGVLPVAWACRATVEGSMGLPGVDCAQKTIDDCTGEPYDTQDLGCTYILMDSVKVQDNKGSKKGCDPEQTDPSKKDYCCDPAETVPSDPDYCYEQKDLVCSAHLDPPTCKSVQPNTTDCDLDNDCIDELMTGGARSWLDLNGGGGGANELTDWITNGFPDPIPPHKWIPEESGVATSIFHTAAAAVVGKDVVLPVFNKFCEDYPNILEPATAPGFNDETRSQCTYSLPPDNLSIARNNYFNFHIITFAEFHVTCVQTAHNKVTAETGYVFDNPQKDCNGHHLAACLVKNKGKCVGSIDENDKTIEGYFKINDLGGYGGPGDWFNTGAFTVILVK
jgi:Flp pilus assembly protein TadG